MHVRRAMRGLMFGGLLLGGLLPSVANADDQPQWGERYSRNMVSTETGLPLAFNPKTGEHILWSVPLGGRGYVTPVVAGGKVLIGANNAEPRDPRHQGDRGVLLCLDEKDGSLSWQLVVPRIEEDSRMDWPNVAMCSPPTVEGDRVYMLTNRYEVVCLDLGGLANGNDGPYQDEGLHLAPKGAPPVEPGPTDADILWVFDLPSEVGIYKHDSAYASILLDGPYLYLNTCNGVTNPAHDAVPSPDAASFIVLDKATGNLVAKEGEGIARRTFHSTWSSPALGVVNGRREVFFGAPDGIFYAFDALPSAVPKAAVTLQTVWRFDFDPSIPNERDNAYVKNPKEGPSTMLAMPVFYKNSVYLAVGGDLWWGKREAWLKCVDATGTGDVTTSAERWSYPLERHVLSTPAVYNGLVFVADCGGTLHCVDAETGRPYWTHKVGKEIWGSPLVADGKVHIGDREGHFAILAADTVKNVLVTVEFGEEIDGTATAANGVLYVASVARLYAVK